jgi:hypothetical protein
MNDKDTPMTPAMFAWLLEELVEEARDRGLSDSAIAAALEAAAAALWEGMSAGN